MIVTDSGNTGRVQGESLSEEALAQAALGSTQTRDPVVYR
jgi:hypothetical protein